MTKKRTDIADYDSLKYNYEEYWKGRSYENASDNIALQTLLQKSIDKIKKEQDVYIDIGSSYGRQVPMYQEFFKTVILFDYSIESLKKAKKYCDVQGLKNTYFIAGDLYFMPFKKGTIQAGQMVRVMHHIKDVKAAFREIDRVIGNFFILEFANKVHAKYRMKHLLSPIDNKPMQQVFRSTSQGSAGENQIFLNFPPVYIKKMLQNTGFSVFERLSVSNFRMPMLKKLISEQSLTQFEKILQKPLASVSFGPSIYFLLEKEHSTHKTFTLETSLCCPQCKGDLSKQGTSYHCDSCNKTFPLTDGVFDFR